MNASWPLVVAGSWCAFAPACGGEAPAEIGIHPSEAISTVDHGCPGGGGPGGGGNPPPAPPRPADAMTMCFSSCFADGNAEGLYCQRYGYDPALGGPDCLRLARNRRRCAGTAELCRKENLRPDGSMAVLPALCMPPKTGYEHICNEAWNRCEEEWLNYRFAWTARTIASNCAEYAADQVSKCLRSCVATRFAAGIRCDAGFEDSDLDLSVEDGVLNSDGGCCSSTACFNCTAASHVTCVFRNPR